MSQRLSKLTVILLILSFLTTGCWSSKEIDDLAIISIIGIDRITEKGVNKWQVAARFMQANQPGHEKRGSNAENLMKGSGTTVEDAFRDMSKRLPSIPFYGQLGSIVIGERAAREKLPDIVDLAMRHFQARPRTYILVAKGEAFNVLHSQPEIESSLAQEIKDLVSETVCRIGASCRITTADFTMCLLAPDRDAVTAEIQTIHPTEEAETSVEESVIVSGMAVFRGARLVAFLNDEDTLGSQFLTRNIDRAEIAIPVKWDGTTFTYLVNQAKRRIQAMPGENGANYQVRIDVKGSLLNTDQLPITSESMKHVEKACSQTLTQIIERAVSRAQDLEADYLGLSQELHRQNLALWETIKPHWRESFAEAAVDVDVDAKVIFTGILGPRLEFKD